MTNYFEINPNNLIKYFDTRVRNWCEKCKRFNHYSCCPPLIESMDYYKNLIINYNKGFIIIKDFEIDDIKKWKELSKESSETIRNEIYTIKNHLHLKNTLQFGAGSCKYCQSCIYPCRFPKYQLIPIEGIGINVIKLIFDITYGLIRIKFPVEKYGYFYRVGMVIWNE
jgi:predicted metal-binding protein